DLTAPGSIATTAKHLAAYGAVMAGREYAQVGVSEHSFHETYLPPFKAAIDAGSPALMPAFTDLEGVPLTANRAVLQDLVRGQWGFDGIYISDYNAIAELLSHGVAAGIPAAAALALKAGVDIGMGSNAFPNGRPIARERGAVTTADLDAAVRRVLAFKARLGLFDDPYRKDTPELTVSQRAEHREVARDAARRSIVLLSNRGGVLPV